MREERKIQARKHLGLMRGAFASDTAATVEKATIYEDGSMRAPELPEPPFEATETSVTTRFAPSVLADAAGKTVMVSPVSFTRPGGAYEDGAFGPEQIICSESNLYPVLQGIKAAYHDKNRGYAAGQLFTDRAAYLPDVVFSSGGAVRKADILAIAEPNRTRALENHRSAAEADRAIVDRIASLLNIAAANEAETLIVGAFGTGRSGYADDVVIGLFREWIEAHPGAIKTIVFAVPRGAFDAFNEAFGKPAVETPVVVEEEEDDEDEDDWRQYLPEGVTVR
ncbi:TIGR02452 family protein [Xiamenia xianingshaonis]|uniref:TIGR02452 family protein n=1 Tax=Xiamenia xianingshaonis TaxID=2682776 RepID=UPI0028F70673|nr:TIGR02452 family protein [Xiamenia xianingshaonis]